MFLYSLWQSSTVEEGTLCGTRNWKLPHRARLHNLLSVWTLQVKWMDLASTGSWLCGNYVWKLRKLKMFLHHFQALSSLRYLNYEICQNVLWLLYGLLSIVFWKPSLWKLRFLIVTCWGFQSEVRRYWPDMWAFIHIPHFSSASQEVYCTAWEIFQLRF
jgi:hypothetical protein